MPLKELTATVTTCPGPEAQELMASHTRFMINSGLYYTNLFMQWSRRHLLLAIYL